MIAEIICVGTELLLGNTVNTNATFLGKELATVGIFTYHQTVVGDNSNRLKAALLLALSRSDIVITTGGLGPTYDDLTKETVADLFDLKLEIHQHSLNRIKDFFQKINRNFTKNNEKQALMPQEATVFDNDFGTAPAFAIEKNFEPYSNDKVDKNQLNSKKIVIMLPGPPREMEPIFNEKIKPFLLEKSPNKILLSKIINIFGIGESAVENKLKDLMQNSIEPTVAPYAKFGEVEIRVTAAGKNIEECEAKIMPTVNRIKSELNEFIYGIDAGSLQQALVNKLQQKNLTISTAESCTGGLISKRITDISGASKIFLGGIVSYSNESKAKILGVNKQIIDDFGAVSEQVALEMAEKVATVFDSDIGLSTTGIAGPQTSDKKPVGLVFIGIFNKKSKKSFTVRLNLSRGYKDERENIRYLASSYAINEVLKLEI